jgi:hypothetical protein
MTSDSRLTRPVGEGAPEQTVRMTLRDRLLRGDPVVGVLGPMRVPPRDAIVRAVREIAQAGPHTRVALGFDADGRSWHAATDDLDAWCEEIVVSVPAPAVDDIVAFANRQAWLLDAHHPLRIILAGDYVVQVNDHALGDGVLFVERLAAIISLAAGATVVPDWLATVPERFPLRRAVRHTLGNRRALAALLSERRDDQVRARAYPAADEGPVRPWRPDMGIVVTRVPAPRMSEFRAAVQGTSATLTSALIVVMRRALRAEEIALARDTSVIYNLRRYLPDGTATVDGNFVSGLPIRAHDPDDPVSVAAVMREQIASARPLAALVVGVVKATVVGLPSRLWQVVTETPAAHLMFNNLGKAEAFDGLPWTTSPGDRTSAIINRPGGPADLSVLVVMVAGVLHVTASFHSNVLDEAAVQRAFDRFAADPVGLLQDSMSAAESPEPTTSDPVDVKSAGAEPSGREPADAAPTDPAPTDPAAASEHPARPEAQPEAAAATAAVGATLAGTQPKKAKRKRATLTDPAHSESARGDSVRGDQS